MNAQESVANNHAGADAAPVFSLDARSTLTTANERLMHFARERPLTTLAVALVSGFVLGKLVSRI